jgi:hypothetical protein
MYLLWVSTNQIIELEEFDHARANVPSILDEIRTVQGANPDRVQA